jgi:hypothetical protein
MRGRAFRLAPNLLNGGHACKSAPPAHSSPRVCNALKTELSTGGYVYANADLPFRSKYQVRDILGREQVLNDQVKRADEGRDFATVLTGF